MALPSVELGFFQLFWARLLSASEGLLVRSRVRPTPCRAPATSPRS